MTQPKTPGASDTDSAAIKATLRDAYKAMLAADTSALRTMLDDGFTLTHITGVVQPRAEWLADIDKRRMAYHSARAVSIEARPSTPNGPNGPRGAAATAVARHVVEATIYGGRGTWNLQLAADLVRRDQRWLITRMVATTFR